MLGIVAQEHDANANQLQEEWIFGNTPIHD